MFDLLALLLLGGAAVGTTLGFLLARGGRWIWFGASLALFLLVLRLMLFRWLPELAAAPAPLPVLADQGLATLAAMAAAFAADAAIRRHVWQGWLGEHGRARVPSIVIGLASLAGYGAVALLIAAGIWGLDVTAVAATSGVVAIVLGVSAQQTLGQVFAGIALNLSRPFRIGDSLQVDGVWGVVANADWRAVTLRTYEGNLVTLPNTLIATARLTNLDAPTHELRHHIAFVADIDTPPGQVRRVALEAMRGQPHVLEQPAPLLLFKEFNERGAHYEAIFWHRDPNLFILRRDEVGQALWYAFRRAGIGFAVHRRLLERPAEAPAAEPPRLDRAALARLLGRSPPFAGLPEAECAALAERARPGHYAAGEPVIREGAAGDSLFLILEGGVSVRRHDATGAEHELYTQGPGTIFGHMSAMTGAPRFATVRATEPLALAEIDAASLAPLIAARPDLVESVAREILRIEAADRQLRAPGQPGAMTGEADAPHLLGRLAERISLFFRDRAAGNAA